ncbi:hypothetical protein GF385_04340 [Candidatus Dependentiae bacterium]|nr:hypothetical protein [Candidatus Dependentiae bacterium]
MKKVILFIATLSFSVAVNAQSQTEVESNWKQKAKDKCNELYVKIKDNKYAKYGIIGAASVLGTTGVVCGINKMRKNRKNKTD